MVPVYLFLSRFPLCFPLSLFVVRFIPFRRATALTCLSSRVLSIPPPWKNHRHNPSKPLSFFRRHRRRRVIQSSLRSKNYKNLIFSNAEPFKRHVLSVPVRPCSPLSLPIPVAQCAHTVYVPDTAPSNYRTRALGLCANLSRSGRKSEIRRRNRRISIANANYALVWRSERKRTAAYEMLILKRPATKLAQKTNWSVWKINAKCSNIFICIIAPLNKVLWASTSSTYDLKCGSVHIFWVNR